MSEENGGCVNMVDDQGGITCIVMTYIVDLA